MKLNTGNRILLMATFGLVPATLTGGKATAAPPPVSSHAPKQQNKPAQNKTSPNKTSVGNLSLINWKSSLININRGTSQLTGPDIIIESRDKTQPTQFRLIVDALTAKRILHGKKEMATAEMSGNVRYTITQQTKEGTRTIEGTAGHASYDEAAQQLRLTEGVRATLTEAAQLEGPAKLRSSTATIMTDHSERYDLAGDPNINDIQLTPLRTAKVQGKAEPQPIAGAPIHVHGFLTGEIQMGHSLVVNGPGTVVDMTDPVDQSNSTLIAEHVAADFDKAVTRADAKTNVHFHYDRPNPDKKSGRQSLTGHSDTATYAADAHRLTATGNVEADIVDPASLLEPAHLVAGQVTMHTEEPVKPAQPAAAAGQAGAGPAAGAKAPTQYDISGSPERTSLVFRPRPKEKAQGKQAGAAAPGANNAVKADAPQSFALGMVHVTGFDKGVYVPGQNAALTGDGTLLHTEDKQAHTASTLRASHMTAKFASDQTIERLDALGNVRFEMEQPAKEPQDAGVQPAADKAPAGGVKIQITKATATQATLTMSKTGQILTVPGPWKANQTTDEPNKLAFTTGEKGDTMTWNLTTGDQEIDNASGLASMYTDFATPQTAQQKATGTPSKPQPSKRRNH